jgi:hypothetical protein
MYSSTLSLTSAFDGVCGQRHESAVLPPGKMRYSLYRRLGRPLSWSWTGAENVDPTGIRSPDRPASRYTD